MYFPKHSIQTDLYTNGDEFVIAGTILSYTGPYWKMANGRTFSGKTPQSPNQYEIVPKPQTEDFLSSEYNQEPLGVKRVTLAIEGEGPEVAGNNYQYDVTQINSYFTAQSNQTQQYPIKYQPVFFQTQPTEDNYQIGEFRRYFCKRANMVTYIEINQKDYNLLKNKDPKIYFEAWIPFYLDWQISGDKKTVYQVNKNNVQFTSQRLKLPKLGDYLKNDYLKYYQE